MAVFKNMYMANCCIGASQFAKVIIYYKKPENSLYFPKTNLCTLFTYSFSPFVYHISCKLFPKCFVVASGNR